MEQSGSKGVVIVTGGGRGIGARTAVRAAEAGHPVAIVYRSRDETAAAVVKEIEALGVQAIAIRADIAVEDDIMRVYEEVDRTFESLGGLVNNAATNGGRALVKEVERSQLEEVWATNVTAPFLFSREAVRRMSTSNGGNGGAIVNISSIASRTGSANVWVHYAASKAALETMSIGLAKETAMEGIRVNVVRCGVFDTEAHAGFGEDRLDFLRSQIPMKRMGDANEAANVAGFLLSEKASYVTGAVIEAGGGM